MLAPNLTHLVGPSLAALLVGMAGGLADLARVPACNMTVMGQEKRYLGGFGMVAGMMVMICLNELIPTAHRYDPCDTVVTKSVVAGMAVMAASLCLFVYG